MLMADVTSPQEAMARFKSLPAAQKMQIMAMLMRVQDDGRRRRPDDQYCSTAVLHDVVQEQQQGLACWRVAERC